MSEVSSWHKDLQRVITLNRSVRPAEAEDLLKKLILECPPQELWAMNPEMTAALESFLPKRRRALDGLLKQRLASPSDHAKAGGHPDTGVAMAAAPRVPDRREKAASKAPDPVALAIREIVRLNGTGRQIQADAKFRGLVGSLSASALTAREAELRGSLETFLPRRQNALNELLYSALNVLNELPPVSAAEVESVPVPDTPAQTAEVASAPANTKRAWGTTQPRPDLAYVSARFTEDLDEPQRFAYISVGHILPRCAVRVL